LTKKIVLSIRAVRDIWREAIEGIASYKPQDGPWQFIYDPDQQSPKQGLGFYKGADGLIIADLSRSLKSQVERLKIPVVVLHSYPLDVPKVIFDDYAAGRLAYEHLRDAGFRRFGFIGVEGAEFSDHRRDQLREYAKRDGLDFHEWPKTILPAHGYPKGYPEDLIPWLQDIRKPAGLLVATAFYAQQVAMACREACIGVPDQLGILAVDDDECICDLSDPPLSTVDQNAEKLGYEAAALMDRLLQGQPASQQPVVIQPRRVVIRASTDVLAIEDPMVAGMVRFIRDNACEGIRASDVHQSVSVSTRTAEMHFAKAMGRTIQEDIIRVRLEEVRQLLIDTPLSLPEIADRTGFEYVSHMSRLFSQRIGQPPGEYRKEFRKP
jgi:LacI family transcriptional regulator